MVRERGAEWAGWTRTLAESRVQQVAAFHQQVRSWTYRDLYTRQSIERMVPGGDCFVDDWLQEIPARDRARRASCCVSRRARSTASASYRRW